MIVRDDRGPIACIRLAHGKASALDLELCGALVGELDAIEHSEAHRAVVLTGTGSIFSAGVDLFQVLERGAPYVAALLPALERAMLRLFTFPRPVVGALNGHAIAGGCVLASACDYRIMAEGEGTIGLPELRVGVPFPRAALEIVRSATAPLRFRALIHRGDTVTPEVAERRGLVDEVVPPERLLDRACEVAAELASIPARAFEITKRQILEPSLDAIERARAAGEEDVAAAWKDPGTHNTIRAYLEKTLGRKGDRRKGD
ncbi:MAG: enoyl-CoA hydratase/isomerase family protein [Gemmatimonadota bacterium]